MFVLARNVKMTVIPFTGHVTNIVNVTAIALLIFVTNYTGDN